MIWQSLSIPLKLRTKCNAPCTLQRSQHAPSLMLTFLSSCPEPTCAQPAVLTDDLLSEQATSCLFRVKLKAFHKFEDTADAVQSATALIEGKAHLQASMHAEVDVALLSLRSLIEPTALPSGHD